jgi:uncharacterized membrane protein
MASTLLWVLRFLHIISGVAWVGGAFIWVMVISPRLLKNGPPPIRRPVMEALVHAVPRYFYAAGGATILWGVLLLGTTYGWANFGAVLQGTYAGKSYGYALGVGLVLAILMLLEGIFVITPTADKMLATMQSLPAPAPGGPPSPPPPAVQAQLAAFGKKLGISGVLNVAMGTLAIAAMTWAVNQVR